VKSKSLRALAKEIGVSPAYLCQIKSGKKKPSVKVLTKLLTNANQDQFDVGAYFSYNSIVTGESSSGRTADSGSVSEGSNPSSPANQEAAWISA
jgi:transcriptional regulator with XRE-family HTH domain